MDLDEISQLLEKLLEGFLVHPVHCKVHKEPILTIIAFVDEDDMRRVIGKEGRTIHSIRQILSCLATRHSVGRINFNAQTAPK